MMDPEDPRVKELQQLAWGLQSLTNKPGNRLPDKFKSECYKLSSRAQSLCSDVPYTEEQDFVERSKVFFTLLEAKKLECAEVEETEKAKITGKCYRSTSEGYYTVQPLTDSTNRSAASQAAASVDYGRSMSSTAGGARALTASEVAARCAEDPEVLFLCHLGLGDGDVETLCQGLQRGGSGLTTLDVSHNLIADVGVQRLVTALAAGTCPKLKELHIGCNTFGELGTTMLKGGLATLRRDLVVHLDDRAPAETAQDSTPAGLDDSVASADRAQELASPLPAVTRSNEVSASPMSSSPHVAAPASAETASKCPAAAETCTLEAAPLATTPAAAAPDGDAMHVELVRVSDSDGVVLRAVLSLPEDVAAASDLDVDISPWRIVVRRASGSVLADSALPCAVMADDAQAKFSKKRHTMTFTCHPADPAAAAAHGT